MRRTGIGLALCVAFLVTALLHGQEPSPAVTPRLPLPPLYTPSPAMPVGGGEQAPSGSPWDGGTGGQIPGAPSGPLSPYGIGPMFGTPPSAVSQIQGSLPPAPSTSLPRSPASTVPGAAPVLPGGMGAALPFNARMQMPAIPWNPTSPNLGQPPALSMPSAAGLPQPAPALGGQKPFADYRQPSPVSPYMNLYQPHAFGVDPYNQFVRPQLAQQAFNQQTQSQIQNLQSANNTQGAALQYYHDQMMPIRGATFMQFQQYYPGFGAAGQAPQFNAPSGRTSSYRR